MKRKLLNTKGFAPIVLLIAVAAVLVVGGGGAYVYHKSHKTKLAVVTATSTSRKTSTQTSKSGTASATSNPYAGWTSANLKYEGITFKYPTTWQISNTSKTEEETGGTVTPGADTAILASPTGLQVSIMTGVAGIGDSDGIDSVLPGARPITALGSNYYLDFYTNTAISSADAQGACLDQEATATGVPYIASKNIQLANVSYASTSPAADSVCIQYQQVQGQNPEKPVSTFEQDASYNDAKLIIESLTY